MIPTRFFVASLVSGLGACTLPPLRGEMEIGKDAYAVFVGPARVARICMRFGPVAALRSR